MNTPKPSPKSISFIEEMKQELKVETPKPKAPKHHNRNPKNMPLKGHPGLMALKSELEASK